MVTIDSLSADNVGEGEQVDSLSKVQKSPLDNLYEGFKWKGEFWSQEKINIQLHNFLEGIGVKLNLNADNVQEKMNTSLDLAEKWYGQVFPKNEMTYHNVDHVTVTSAVAMKVFLGKLESLRYKNNGQGLFENKEAMDKVIATASAVFALHEVDDWWGGGESTILLEEKLDFKKMKLNLDAELEERGVVATDFNKLMKLDDFVRDLPDMLADIEKSGVDDFLEMVPIDQRMEIAEAIGEALNMADFAQICNESYSEESLIVDKAGDEHKTFRGVLALAREFEIYRPNGLKGAGWAKSDETTKIDLDKTKWTRWFYDNKAFPRIMRGLQSLWLFDSDEAERLWKRLEVLETQFAD